jgi:hypothetical protein
MIKKKLILLILLPLIILCGGYFFWNCPFYKIYRTAEYELDKPEEGLQIIRNAKFEIITPTGWIDKGYSYGTHGQVFGRLKKGEVEIKYVHGLIGIAPSETLNEYLFNSKLNLFIMGTRITNKKDEQTVITFEWPANTDSADTLETGKIKGEQKE